MFPDDEVANLNAANAAMDRGDMKNAEYYLKKAGNSPQAVYGRGTYAALKKEFDMQKKCLLKLHIGGWLMRRRC